jgi:PhnB protein
MSEISKAVAERRRGPVPHLVLKGAAAALDFYRSAFGAEETYRMEAPDGASIMHAEMAIGDDVLFLTDENPDMGSLSPLSLGGASITLNLVTEDVDALYARLVDPYGHSWALVCPLKQMSREEIETAARQYFSGGE